MSDSAESQTVTAFATIWADIKDATFDERTDFRDHVVRMSVVIDRRVAELDAQASAVRSASQGRWSRGLVEFRAARVDLGQRLAALGEVSASSWEGARARTVEAWERVQRAYQDLESGVAS